MLAYLNERYYVNGSPSKSDIGLRIVPHVVIILLNESAHVVIILLNESAP